MPGILNRRKRPSVAVSDDDDDEQSDGSYVSTGSKRARHARDASDSPAPTKGYPPTPRMQNGHNDDNEYAEEVHQPGSLVRVKLTNFVTYTAAEFQLGPSLNMIIGPNGTGKSTLVCAICLGLGWSPQHLGRAKEIGEFVKHGHGEAEIEVELAASENQRTNPIIRRVIRKEGNKSAFFINGRNTSQKEVVALAKSFSIQIDNLCQFLPQDRVVEFARLEPVALLRETQRAAAPEQMVQWHDALKQLRGEEKSLEQQQKDNDHHMKTLQAKQNATREDVERWNQRQELIVKSRALEKCRPVINTKIMRAEIKQMKSDLSAEKQELARYNAEMEPARQAQAEMEAYRDQVSQVAKTRKSRFDAAKGVVDRLATKIETEQRTITNFSAEIEAEKQAEKTRRQDVKRIEGDIIRLKRAKDDNPVEYDHADFESRKAELRTERSSLERRVVELSTDLKDTRTQAVTARSILQRKTDDREQLNTQSGQQATLLAGLSRDTAIGWDWLQKNMGSLPLKDDVYPPAILCCSVPDARYADAVESQLRPGDLTAITCGNGEDAKLISDKLLGKKETGGLGLHQVSIRTAPQRLTFYRAPVTKAELERYGFESWIIDHIQGPEPVLAMLCDSAGIQRAAFALRPISNEQHAALQDSPISKWVTGSEICQITKRREYDQSSTSVKQLRKAQYFTGQPIDTEEKRRLDIEIRDLGRDIEHLRSVHNETKQKLEQLTEDQARIDAQKGEIQAQQDRMKKAYAEWHDLPRKIATKQAELDGLQALNADTHRRIQAIRDNSEQASLKIATLTIEYATAVIQLRAIHESMVEAELRLIEANSEVDGFMADNAHILRVLDEKKAAVRELEETIKDRTAAYKRDIKIAERIIKDLTEDERSIVREFSNLASVEELDNEITAVNARLDLMAEGNPHAIHAYERRQQQIEKAQESLSTVAEDLEEKREQIRQIRERWEPELDQLVAKISDGFSHNFQQIGCAGQVGVYKDEDFENWSIQIQVRFRENESLSILDSHRQSGGERAVSTIFYLMALQDLARSPFRVVDEINQGMDPRNERMVHERMVDIACRERTSQYFLITPKLLNDLKFHPKMKVHCIASGEHMPDQNTNLDFQRLAKVALRVRKQAMAAA